MILKRTIVGATLCGALVLGAGTTAFAGETGGSGKPLPLQGNSACMFSGLNDEPDAPGPEGGRTQSWGQLVRKLGYAGAVAAAASFGESSPGVSCNGNLNGVKH